MEHGGAHRPYHYVRHIRKPWVRALHYEYYSVSSQGARLTTENANELLGLCSGLGSEPRGCKQPHYHKGAPLSFCAEHLSRHNYLRHVMPPELQGFGGAVAATACGRAFQAVLAELDQNFDRSACCSTFPSPTWMKGLGVGGDYLWGVF